MIVVTATLLFLLLLFAPIRFRLSTVLFLQHLYATVKAKIGVVKVFDEQLQLSGKYLHCFGTVSTVVDITKVDKKSGVDLLKCITVDKISIRLVNNLTAMSVYAMLFENVLSALAMATLCNLSHCQFYTEVVGTCGESCVQFDVVASTSVAELSFCLLKQGVKLWKTQTSKKS